MSLKDAGGVNMSDPKVVWGKFQGLVDATVKKLDKKEMNEDQQSQVHFALAAYIQLVSQIKEIQADMRDKAFENVGQDATSKDVEGLNEMLDYAVWAYDEDTPELLGNLEGTKYKLLKHDLTKQVGRVGHFIAINPDDKRALFGVKGSSNLEDLITDVCAKAVPHELKAPFRKDGPSTMRCHEGILESAKNLVHDIEPVVRHLLLPLGYKLVLCGHSLGAGAAALAAPMLMSEFPELRQRNRIQVMAFACPPVMDFESAMACKSFTQTVVNNSDVIPRTSLGNLEVLVECLMKVHQKLVEKGHVTENDWQSTWSIFNLLREGNDGEMLMTPVEARDVIIEAQEEVKIEDPDHLYVPGRVLMMYHNWTDINKAKKEIQKKKKDSKDSEKGEEVEMPPLPVYGKMTDGAASVLRLIEIDERMISDHFSLSYEQSVDGLKPAKSKDDPCSVM